MKFPQLLRQERELRGWSQSRAAQELGTTPNTISAWERGLSLPSPYFREKLCALLDKNAQELGLLPTSENPAVAVAQQGEEEPDDTQLDEHLETPSEQATTPIYSANPAPAAKRTNRPAIPFSLFYTLESRRGITLFSRLLALLIIGSAIVAWPLLVSPDPYAPGKGRLVLNDPLKDQGQQFNWQEGWNENGAACQFKRDAYYAIQPLAGYFHACIAQNTSFHNFAYEVEATLYQGDYVGIIFRAASSLDSQYYLFRVSRDGSYMLKRYVDRLDAHAILLDNGTSTQFHRGTGQSNKLAVVAQNQHLTLYINQQVVTSVIDQTHSEGQIGVLAGNDTHPPAEAAFRNAKVWSW
jgi:transcriptional regulator with XRE-family HTH domain